MLTLMPTMWANTGPALTHDTPIQFEVLGLSPGRHGLITKNPIRWQTWLEVPGGKRAHWEGDYRTIDEALAALADTVQTSFHLDDRELWWSLCDAVDQRLRLMGSISRGHRSFTAHWNRHQLRIDDTNERGVVKVTLQYHVAGRDKPNDLSLWRVSPKEHTYTLGAGEAMSVRQTADHLIKTFLSGGLSR